MEANRVEINYPAVPCEEYLVFEEAAELHDSPSSTTRLKRSGKACATVVVVVTALLITSLISLPPRLSLHLPADPFHLHHHPHLGQEEGGGGGEGGGGANGSHYHFSPSAGQGPNSTEWSSLRQTVIRLVEKYRVDLNQELQDGLSPWTLASNWATERHVIPDPAPQLGAVLHALSTTPVVSVTDGGPEAGTQLKLFMKLDGGQSIVFKPKWYERDYILEGPPSAGRDRHNGEVAAFHLSRILGFRKTPLAVGRSISLSQELIPVASEALLDTFHEEEGMTCFYGTCQQCSKDTTLCTADDQLEGAAILWLPAHFRLATFRNPWRRMFQEKLLARWEKEEDYCNIVQQIEPFRGSDSMLLDLVDTTVLDYLVDNADRHHLEVVQSDSGLQGMLVMLDNGKSFGNPFKDDRSLLAPLYQCCRIRFKTWQTLLSLQHGVLSSVLREVLKADPLHPVLTTPHLHALDRRLTSVIREVEACIQARGLQKVMVMDSGEQVTPSDADASAGGAGGGADGADDVSAATDSVQN